MVELAKITKALPRRHQDLPTVSSRCHRMAGTERQFVPLQQNVQNVSAAFAILERERENAQRWASEFMGYCKDMIIIVRLPAFPPPLNILFKGAQQTPGDVLEMKRF